MTIKQRIDDIFLFTDTILESVSSDIDNIIMKKSKASDSFHPEAQFKHFKEPPHRPFIAIYPKFNSLNKKVQLHVILHELGHWFRDMYISLADIMGWEEGENFNIYSMGNSEEGFAEAFATYFTDNNHLKTQYPEQYIRMEKWVKPHKNIISKKAKELLKQGPED